MARRLWTVALACVLVSMVASADAQTDFDKARVAYLGRRYDEAEDRLRSLLAPNSPILGDPFLLVRARMYFAATLIARQNREQAVQVMERIILEDPSFEPDPLVFPSEVHDVFIDTRSKMTERINQAKAAAARLEAERREKEEADKRRQAQYLAELKRLATEEKTTYKHSRWVALVPFGVGQFQNGDTALGWVFLGTEVAALVGAAALVPFYVDARNEALRSYAAGDSKSAESYHDREVELRTANVLVMAAFAAVAIGGVIQAQANFVPDRVEIKKRPLPVVRLSPDVRAVAGGGIAGVGGSF